MGGGGGRVGRRSEAFVKIQKRLFFYCIYLFIFYYFFYFIFFFFFFLGGGGGGSGRVGSQGRCERRSEAFVKIQKKKIFFWGGGRVWGQVGGRGLVGGGVRVDVNREVKLL